MLSLIVILGRWTAISGCSMPCISNPTIGITLCLQKNEAIVKYSVLNDAKQIFASRYSLELPTAEELQHEIEAERKRIEDDRNKL